MNPEFPDDIDDSGAEHFEAILREPDGSQRRAPIHPRQHSEFHRAPSSKAVATSALRANEPPDVVVVIAKWEETQVLDDGFAAYSLLKNHKEYKDCLVIICAMMPVAKRERRDDAFLCLQTMKASTLVELSEIEEASRICAEVLKTHKNELHTLKVRASIKNQIGNHKGAHDDFVRLRPARAAGEFLAPQTQAQL